MHRVWEIACRRQHFAGLEIRQNTNNKILKKKKYLKQLKKKKANHIQINITINKDLSGLFCSLWLDTIGHKNDFCHIC